MLVVFGFLATPAFAATYYVRTDGGDATQCTGTTDAAYSGSGSAQACAWKHPFMALPPGGTARIVGGDTLIIGPGQYMMGLGAPGATNTSVCYSAWSYDCHMPSIPSGPSAAQKTRILGKGWDQGCPVAPQLWGTERSSPIIGLNSSSNVEVGCLEITDHSDCIEFHCTNGQCFGGAQQINACPRNTPPFGQWSSVGIQASNSRNVLLHDLDIHGMANRGIIAGGLTDWTLQNVKIVGNPWAGFDGDIGAGSSNSGTITFNNVEVGWNGCGERYPSRVKYGCWGQMEAGYGDGLGTGSTGGNWVIVDSDFHHNTSDGLDLLYANGTGSITVLRSHFEGNAGNQLKTSGPATIENNVVVGNCAYFDHSYNMSSGDQCRALGNTVSIALGTAAAQVNLRYNTITGQGDCLILSGGGNSSARLNVQNNALIGQADYWDGVHGNPEQTCVQYADGGAAQVNFLGNYVWNVKNGACPPGSTCNVPPMIASSQLNGFDPSPLIGSPLLDHANATVTVTTDGRSRPRPFNGGYDIGAIEFQGAADLEIFQGTFD